MNQLGLPISLDSKMLLDNFVGNKELLEFIDQFYEKKKSVEINNLFENHKNLPIKNFRNIGMIWAYDLDSNIDINKLNS